MNHSDIMRVFISSTFVGLENERNYLMSKTFPMLKHEAIKRGKTLIPIDLRWGVTKEQAEQGKVIWICLKEIEKAKPFFISILGKRYGWQPDYDILEKDTQLAYSFPDVQLDLESNLSMSEIEIQHAVLRNKTESINAYFYITDDPNLEEPQKRLVERIISDGRFEPKYFHTQEELGNLVYNDIMGLLNAEKPIPLMSEYDRLSYYQHTELSQLIIDFLNRKEITSSIESFVKSTKFDVLTLIGPKGSGKSCLLADWLSRNENETIYLFIDGLLTDSSYKTIQKYILFEIGKKTGMQISINDDDPYSQLETVFDSLSKSNQKITIVLDGLNQIIEADNKAHSPLSWIPIPPKGIKYIISTNSEEQVEVLRNRGAEVINVLPLSIENRKEMICRYLHRYSKKLTDEQVSQLAFDTKSSNAALLTSMLNEMVSDSVYETVDNYINQFTEATDTTEFYVKLISRACEKYDVNSIKEIFGLITVSKSGLKIDEIIEILHLSQINWSLFYCAYSFLFGENNGLIAIKNEDVRNIIKTRILDSSLKEKLIKLLECYFANILHEQKRIDSRPATLDEIESVINLSLDTKSMTDKNRTIYINSFLFYNYLFDGKERALVELAHIYWLSNQIEKLYNHLLYPVCLIYLQRSHFESLVTYWKFIMNNDSNKSIIDYSILKSEDEECYTDIFKSDYYYSVAELADNDSLLLNSDYAIHFVNRSLAHLERCSLPGADLFLESRYSKLASLYYRRKDFKKASYYYQKTKESLNSENSLNSIISSINDAQNQYDLGNYEHALMICSDVLERISSVRIPPTLKNEFIANVYNIMGNSYSDKAHALSEIQYLDESISYLEKAVEIYENLMTLNSVSFAKPCVRTLSNLASSLKELNRFKESIEYFNKALSILENNDNDIESQEILARIKMNLGVMLTDLGYDYKKSDLYRPAVTALHEALVTYQSLYKYDNVKYLHGFADAFYNFGRLARRMKEFPQAIYAFENAMQLDHSNDFIAACLLALGLVYMETKEERKMKEVFTKSLSLYELLFHETSSDIYKQRINQIKLILNK